MLLFSDLDLRVHSAQAIFYEYYLKSALALFRRLDDGSFVVHFLCFYGDFHCGNSLGARGL